MFESRIHAPKLKFHIFTRAEAQWIRGSTRAEAQWIRGSIRVRGTVDTREHKGPRLGGYEEAQGPEARGI